MYERSNPGITRFTLSNSTERQALSFGVQNGGIYQLYRVIVIILPLSEMGIVLYSVIGDNFSLLIYGADISTN